MTKPLSPGCRIAEYTIVRHVATGGMGAVWRGEAPAEGGTTLSVAVKTIRPELAGDAAFRAMFVEEARISSRLAHRNVAKVLGVGEDDGTTYIAFEWVEGRSLDEVCLHAEERGAPLALDVGLRILADVCAGLHAVHELRSDAGELLHVVHRDVTPSNVLVGKDGVAKVIDLGVAKARDRAGVPTRSGVAKGTPQFMAPEQAMGQPVDRRADVFAVGAVLYRVLAGRAPFRDHDALAAFVMGRPPPPLPADVPPAVRALVDKAMCSDPDARFTTAAELGVALERAARRVRVSSTPRWLVVGLAFAAGLVALAMALALRS